MFMVNVEPQTRIVAKSCQNHSKVVADPNQNRDVFSVNET